MSFDIALSGIQSINEQLNATSNNIANAGTYGFKSSRANFAAMYAGSQPTGTEIGSMTQSIGLSGGILNTGRSLDASISGRGFFSSKGSDGTMTYSRVGIFTVDKAGVMVDSAGRKVQGYAAVTGTAALGALGDLVVPTGQIPAKASSELDYVGNLSADWTVKTVAFDPAAAKPDSESYNMSKQSVVFDSLGTQHTMTQYFVKTGTNSVTSYYKVDDGATPITPASQALTFASNGSLATPATAVNLTVTPTNGSAAMTVALDYTGTTQFSGDSITSTNSTDGYASGTYTGTELGDDGSVIAQYSNGQKQTVGTIALATFPDEDGLTAINDTSWTASNTSGTPLYTTPGVGNGGSLTTSSLEQSNVDITTELVGLMTSQRNYQANSKVISTESTMLQSLMQAI